MERTLHCIAQSNIQLPVPSVITFELETRDITESKLTTANVQPVSEFNNLLVRSTRYLHVSREDAHSGWRMLKNMICDAAAQSLAKDRLPDVAGN